MDFNGTMMQYFEWYLPKGMLWKQLADEAASLAANGVTALWIPPAYKGQGEDDVGYGVYDHYDLGEFDQKGTVPTKYGTKQELINAIAQAHNYGMQVYADVVLDHLMGADGTEKVTAKEVNPDNRYEAETDLYEIMAWTHFYFPGRNKKYSDFEWHWYHFVAVDWDENTEEEGIFKFAGKKWHRVDRENGTYDYLMGADIDLSNKEVCTELLKWGKWFVHETDVDGFRMDAVKHMKFTFANEWLDAMREEMGREFFTVGEYWNGRLGALKNYVDTTQGALSLFDVALHFRFRDASVYGKNFDLRGIFDGTLTKDNPLKSVTFVDCHDTQPRQALASWVSDWFKPHAYALILLRQEGYPCVFYGDYYGIAHDGVQPMRDMLHPLMHARRDLAFGKQNDYFDHPNLVGWTREGDERHPGSGLAVLVCNGKGGKKRMHIGKAHTGQVFRDLMDGVKETVKIGSDGAAEFAVPDRGIAVWVHEDYEDGPK